MASVESHACEDIAGAGWISPEQQFSNMIFGEPYVGNGNHSLPRHILFGNLSARGQSSRLAALSSE